MMVNCILLQQEVMLGWFAESIAIFLKEKWMAMFYCLESQRHLLT